MDDRLEFSFVMQEKDYAHFLAMKDQWKAWKSGRRCLHPDERYLRQILASPELKKHLGQWSLIFGEEEICVRQGETGYRFFWKGIGGIVEFPDAFWFYGKEESGLCVIPKGVFPLEDRGAFMHWCRSKEIFCTPYTGGKARKQMPFLLQLFLLFLVFVGLLGLGAGEMLLANRAIKYVQESTSKVDTEDLQKQYPDYLTIEDQIAILRELGFEIPDGAADYYHSWMDDSESGRGYVEGHPFYVLLSDMGQAKYDLDTRMLIGNPDQVFWFPDVSWDISTEYVNIMNGINSIMKENTFISVSEDCSEANFSQGTGVIRITFWCGGQPYSYRAPLDAEGKVDQSLLLFLSQVLQENGYTEKQLYRCPDQDGGELLFWRDAAWIREFREKTGLDPEEITLE